ncbi:TetR/AcrR family transcriptional regulator [Rhodococcus rhodochrous]|uniref:TetR family transcriptional regulator n=1 Tax=Rhodococcus rhodochrous KG-21 TaxID=1441923 RepID=A0A0M8PIT2_RHORH|nr:TetR/AcrR family transcriptional regulator [Rhodococcus rhodochrous]KOS55795.1 TetR family transcriptional regulator [Rhodococcus rhodochrous KG-21]
MGRPAKPLISRSATIAASIELIDTEGFDAFSLPRVARQLKVKTSSLYHHFADRRELVTEVAKELMTEATVPEYSPGTDWVEWFVELSLNYRDAILRHPDAAIVLVQFLPRDVLTRTYEMCARILEDGGVPARLHIVILDGLEKLALATTLSELTRDPVGSTGVFPNVDERRHPTLARALEANRWSSRELFVVTIRGFLAGVLDSARTPVSDDSLLGS